MSGYCRPTTPMSRGENLAESKVPLKARPLWVQMTLGRLYFSEMCRMCSTTAIPMSSSNHQPFIGGALPSGGGVPSVASPQPQ